MNESEAVIRTSLIIFDEPAVGRKPSEGALDDPALALHDEPAASAIEAFDDLQACAASRRFLANEFNQAWARVSRIRPEMAKPTESPQHPRQDLLRTRGVGDARGSDLHPEDQSKGIHHQMSFSAHNFLSSIVATHSRVISCLNTLRVDDRCCRGFFFPCLSRTPSRSAS